MIVYRPLNPATPGETDFVVMGIAHTYRKAFTAGILQDKGYYDVMCHPCEHCDAGGQIQQMLARPDVTVTMAALAGKQATGADLVGFIVADTADAIPLVYYVYVKEHWRRAGNGRLWRGPGVARGLFDAIGVDPAQPFSYVASTPMARTLARKIPLARWDPLVGRFPKADQRDPERKSRA